MNELNIYELYDYLSNTFNHIGTFLYTCSLEEIDYYIFEEFDGECISFLHPNNLSVLLNEKLISKEVYHLSIDLAEKFRSIENTPIWNSTSVKRDCKWQEILILADKIKSLLDSNSTN